MSRVQRRSGFEYVMTLPQNWDARTRICLLPAEGGKHERLLTTHPHFQPMVLDMQAKTFLPLVTE